MWVLCAEIGIIDRKHRKHSNKYFFVSMSLFAFCDRFIIVYSCNKGREKYYKVMINSEFIFKKY